MEGRTFNILNAEESYGQSQSGYESLHIRLSKHALDPAGSFGFVFRISHGKWRETKVRSVNQLLLTLLPFQVQHPDTSPAARSKACSYPR